MKLETAIREIERPSRKFADKFGGPLMVHLSHFCAKGSYKIDLRIRRLCVFVQCTAACTG